jgi:predicted heme/steroid binding protein
VSKQNKPEADIIVLNPDREKPTPANPLLALVLDRLDLFHDDTGVAYAAVDGGIYQVKSAAFRSWLDHAFFRRYGQAMKPQVRSEALAVLEAQARFDRPEQAVHVRVAHHDGCLYLDLANAAHEIVRVTPSGWEVTTDSSVRFRRAKGMAALARPQPGGSVDLLRPFVNVGGDASFHLLLAWLVGGLGMGPYPVLVLVGPRGTAKSTTTRACRRLLDDNRTPIRTLPSCERNLAVSSTNSWVLAYDNLSGLTPKASDWICRVATGGGFSSRQLFTDADETLMTFKRPVILNGIDDIAVRGDLLDRSIVVECPPIPDRQRRDERALWADFEKARPLILGALLDGVAAALRNLDATVLDKAPRMADFARWVTAAETGLGWKPGTFMTAYTQHRDDADADALERSSLAQAVLKLTLPWTGTATALLAELNGTTPEPHGSGWPKDPSSLSSGLRRILPLLATAGVEARFERTKKTKTITITRSPGTPSPASPPSPGEKGRGPAPRSVANEGAGQDGSGDAGDAGDAGHGQSTSIADGAGDGGRSVFDLMMD